MAEAGISRPNGQADQVLSPAAFIAAISGMLEIELPSTDLSVAGNWKLDSLQMLEAALAIEHLTGYLVQEDEAAALATVGDAYALYKGICSGGHVLVQPTESSTAQPPARQERRG